MFEKALHWCTPNLPLPSLALFAAVVLGLILVYVEGRHKALPESRLVDFLLLALLGGMVGGRLIFAALFDSQYYFGQPLHLLHIQDSGFSFWGGLACAFIPVSFWAYRKNLIVERYLDAAAPALAFCLALGYTGSKLLGGEMGACYPWGVTVEETCYHPDGAYAAALLMVVYFILKRRRSRSAYEGELFIWFLIGYSLINILLDFIRDLPRVWGVLTAGQLFSLAVLLFAGYFIVAGPRISIYSSYLNRTIYRHSPAQEFGQFIWHLALTAGMVFFYYWIHRPPTPL